MRALHGAAPWRRRRWERERAGGSGGAAEGRQPRGGVLRGGGGQRRAPPQPPRPRPFPPSMLPAVAASQRSRWAAAREAGREGESSGPGPEPAGERRPGGGGMFHERVLFPSFRGCGGPRPHRSGVLGSLKGSPKLFFWGGGEGGSVAISREATALSWAFGGWVGLGWVVGIVSPPKGL